MTEKAKLTPTALPELLKKASYLALHNEAKRQLYTVFEESLYFAYERGLFQATPEFIQFTITMLEEGKDLLVLDTRKTPVLIEDPQAFLSSMKETYHEALNRYYTDYQALRQARKNEDFIQ